MLDFDDQHVLEATPQYMQRKLLLFDIIYCVCILILFVMLLSSNLFLLSNEGSL